MIEILAFDLDGTLAESKLPIRKDMAKLLQEAAQHLKIAVISGGSFSNFEKQVLATWLSMLPPDEVNHNLMLLPLDGMECYEYDRENSWKKVYKKQFPKDLKERVMRELQKIISSGKYSIPPESERVGEIIEDRGSEINFSGYGQNAPLEKKSSWDATKRKRKKIKAELDKHLGEDCEITIAGTTSIDILPKGQTKAAGLLKLMQRLIINPKRMLFVGDAVYPGGNDYSPYEAGIKTVRVNGPDATKEVIKNFVRRHTDAKISVTIR